MKQINPDLTDFQKKVLFNKHTEPAFSGDLLKTNSKGNFVCVNCGEELFASDTKFDSSSGWPSFYEPVKKSAVRYIEDKSHGMQRIEVVCGRCGGHLGHVFEDGHNQATGKRYCINSASLQFINKS